MSPSYLEQCPYLHTQSAFGEPLNSDDNNKKYQPKGEGEKNVLNIFS
jgi:hypothetical protein